MDIDILYVPYDAGNYNVRMGAGPLYFRSKGIRERLENRDRRVNEIVICASSTWQTEIATAFDLIGSVSRHVQEAIHAGRFPLVLSGNCNMAVGAIGGIRDRAKSLLWFDAHSDFNTPETTTNGSLDQMGLSIATGQCWKTLIATQCDDFEPVSPQNTILVGARDFDLFEEASLARAGVRRINVPEIREQGVGTLLEPHIDRLEEKVTDTYVHLDLDLYDPHEIPSNEFAVPNGLMRDEMREALRIVTARLSVQGAGIASYDPTMDDEERAFEMVIEMIETLV